MVKQLMQLTNLSRPGGQVQGRFNSIYIEAHHQTAKPTHVTFSISNFNVLHRKFCCAAWAEMGQLLERKLIQVQWKNRERKILPIHGPIF